MFVTGCMLKTMPRQLPDSDPRKKLVSKDLITYVTDRKGHDRRYAIAPDKIKAEIGWEPETMFKDGIRLTIAWFFGPIYNAKKKSNECVVSIGFQDVDVSCLTPNKNYRFLFEDTKLSKKYHGSYMLCGTTMTFVKEGKEFTAVVSAIFRKIK